MIKNEIKDALKKNKLDWYCLTDSDLIGKDPWYTRINDSCRKIAHSVGADHVLLGDFNFNAAACSSPKFIAVKFGVLDFSYKTAILVSDYYQFGKDKLISEPKESKSNYKDIFEIVDYLYLMDMNFSQKLDDDWFKFRFEKVASIFVLFTVFHEAGHIYHQHGKRQFFMNIDGMGTHTKELTRDQALDSQAREIVSDAYALQKLVESHFLEIKKTIKSKKILIAFTCEYLTFLNLYFYLLSPKLEQSEYKNSSHPPASVRLRLMTETLLNGYQLGLSKSDKKRIFLDAESSFKNIVFSLFGDKSSTYWMTNIKNDELNAWHQKVYERAINRWYLKTNE